VWRAFIHGYLAAQRFVTKSAVSEFSQIFKRHYNFLLFNITVIFGVTPSGMAGSLLSTKLKGSYPKTSLPHPAYLIHLTRT
jgi:hypothetical protein